METTETLEFGIKRENEERRDGGLAVVFNPQTQKFAVGRQTESGLFRLFSGGVDAGEDIKAGTLREIEEESGLHDFEIVENIGSAFCHYHNSLRNVNRVTFATCFLIVLKSTELKSVHLEEHEKFVLDWVTKDEMISNWNERNQNKDLDHWIYFFKKAIDRLKELEYKV